MLKWAATVAMMTVLISSVLAQGVGVIQGKVTNDEGTGVLQDVNITLSGMQFGVSSDRNGRFEMTNIPEGEYTLVASSVGYQPASKTVLVKAGETISMRVKMTMMVIEMPQIAIFTDREGIFGNTPGSVSYLSKREIDKIDPVSGNEVLRRTPGLHVVDEEGAGMRVNIGVRGLDPARSRSVLVMEDGIPVALAPYGEPEMYYSPAIDRMTGVEVIKGSGSIMYGPQTIGGVVNYITADPPARSRGSVSLRGGEGGFFTGLLSYGNTYGKAGVQVNFLRKQVDNLGMLNYRINDFSTKFRIQLAERSSIGVKLGVYDESSNSTYVGITQAMYDRGGEDFVQIAPDDRLNVRRYSLSGTHKYHINDKLRLTTTAYGYTTTRNWQRQDFAYNSFDAEGNLNPPPSNFTGVVWGDESIEGGAIYMRNSTGNRNRSFEVMGAESKLTYDYAFAGLGSELNIGVRAIHEKAFEQRVNGSSADAAVGDIREDEVRTGIGLSAFVHQRTNITERFSISAGVRVEDFSYERDINRRSFGGVVTDTSLVASSKVLAIIPGGGFNFSLNEYMGVFGGVHRGFAPPRVKDAISGGGEAYDLEAELSWNYELGTRGKLPGGLGYELTAFYMDFENQVIPVSEAAGGLGVGLVNGGATQHYGVEAGFNAEINTLLGFDDLLLLSVSATYVEATFSEDRFIGGQAEGTNISGNRTPYAPELLLSSALTWESEMGLGLRVTSTFIGDQFSDVLNSEEASSNGRSGLIPAYHVLDGGVQYKASKINTVFSISAKNITDERYIVTRRPQGIRVGLPRFITAGVKVNF